MFALYKKEIAAFLNTLIGYVVILVFFLISGLFLWVFPTEYNILDFGYANLGSFFYTSPYRIFIFDSRYQYAAVFRRKENRNY